MDSTALVGLAGAAVGALASALSTWLVQRGQARREDAQRSETRHDRWTADKRATFRDVHVAADDWADLLRRIVIAGHPGRPATDIELLAVERRFHALVYEVALLCNSVTSDAVEGVEDVLLELTLQLGLPTLWTRPAADSTPATGAWVEGDHPDLRSSRVRMLQAMRTELATG